MTVIYIDSVFVLIGLMVYLLLLCAARLAGLPLRRGRYALAALAGGAYAAAVFLPGLDGSEIWTNVGGDEHSPATGRQ